MPSLISNSPGGCGNSLYIASNKSRRANFTFKYITGLATELSPVYSVVSCLVLELIRILFEFVSGVVPELLL
ncbi:hypothetical protein [Thermococcus sp.]|uniref:hypothetical protein n=1 Tax=Thermococcus sp. TaxID=35749 RepID=UPI002619FDE5|nr:hypothetical protein [Thermococcus sp.]